MRELSLIADSFESYLIISNELYLNSNINGVYIGKSIINEWCY